MIEEHMTVGLVVEYRRLGSHWGGHAWRPVQVFPAAPDVAPWTSLGSTSPDRRRFYAGAFDIHLYSTDTANYRDNLASGTPKLWVVLRPGGAEPPIEVALITADPAEGEASTEAGGTVVDVIDMPSEVAGVVAAFVSAHHVERPIIKRKRDRQGQDARWRGAESQAGTVDRPGHLGNAGTPHADGREGGGETGGDGT